MATTPSDMDTELQQAWATAAAAGDLPRLQSLLTAHPRLLNARVRHQSLKAATAMHICAWRNRIAAVEFLLGQGADIALRDETGMTALQMDVLRVCLEKMRHTPLLRSRHIDVQSPVAVANFKRKLVRDRSTYRDIDTTVLELLLAHHVNVNNRSETGDTALLMAIEHGLVKQVEKLVAHGADVFVQDGNGRTTLDLAGENGFADIAALLAQNYPDLIPIAGEMSVVLAVRHDFSEVLDVVYDRLQSTLAAANGLALDGRLLHVAVEYDSPSCAKFLLERDIPIDWPNDQGETAVQAALLCDRPEILELLLERDTGSGACLKRAGSAANQVAALRHRYAEMELLEQSPTHDISSFRDEHRDLPVFFARRKLRLEIQEVLVRHGAKFEFPTSQSRDAVVPLLSACLQRVAPTELANVLVTLVNADCIRHELCPVLVCLMWSKHTQEVLVLVLLILFSSHPAQAQQAVAIFEPWLLEFDANIVTRRLLLDALQTRNQGS